MKSLVILLALALSADVYVERHFMVQRSVAAFAPPAQITYGPPEPDEYPNGVACSRKGDVVFGTQTTDHPCQCKHMGDPATNCETHLDHDPVCKQYCHEKHCSCPVDCPLDPPR